MHGHGLQLLVDQTLLRFEFLAGRLAFSFQFALGQSKEFLVRPRESAAGEIAETGLDVGDDGFYFGFALRLGFAEEFVGKFLGSLSLMKPEGNGDEKSYN